jgi:phosphopantetheine adenylyltransferase
MLIKQCDFNVQRHYDSLHFNHKHHCDQAVNVLENNCIHIKSKSTIIYLSDDELEKLETIKPVLFNLRNEEIKTFVNMTKNKPKDLTWNTPIEWFNQKFGWFFKNGNKA